jgi:hypothetical protein
MSELALFAVELGRLAAGAASALAHRAANAVELQYRLGRVRVYGAVARAKIDLIAALDF